jgi:hypothetical protein
MRWGEKWTKAQAWECPRTPRNIQAVQASKLGDAPEAPPSSLAKIRSPFKTLYFYCFMHYAFFLECQLFLLSVLFCFVCCNKCLDHIMFILERAMVRFSLPRKLYFSLLSFNECSLFLLLRLAFVFCLDFLFRSCYIFASRCIWTSGLCWFSSKELFRKGLNGVGKEKKFQAKKWYKKERVCTAA